MPSLNKTRSRWMLTLSEPEQAALRDALHYHPSPQVRERCAAILKVAQGHSPHWVARFGLLHPRDPDSVYQWVRWYQQDGLADLLARQHGGVRRRRL
jgi:hypothetical protein